MKRLAAIAAIVTWLWCPFTSAAANEWKTFSSRTGWSIEYPSDWSTASCHSCPDPRAPGVYVDFFPPNNQDGDGWVMVEPLASKPTHETADEWLSEIAGSANLNPQLGAKKLTVSGLPALRVLYRTSNGQQMEAVYVVAGRQTFSIGFSGDALRAPINTLPRYAIYNRMIDTFHVRER